LANLLLQRGKTCAALRFVQLSLELKRRLGDRHGQAISLGTRGRIELHLAQYDQARRTFAEDLALAQEIGDDAGIGIMLNSLGETALLQKDLSAAEEYFRFNVASERGSLNAFFAEVGLARVHLASARLDDARAACRRLEDLLGRHPELHDLADVLTGLRGALAWRDHDFVQGEQWLHRNEQLLPHEDADVAAEVVKVFREDGIDVLLAGDAVRVEPGPNGEVCLTVRHEGGERTLAGSHPLVAASRVPNTDRLGLDRAGIAVDRRGYVRVNERLEAGVPGVYALDDVKGGPAFTHISYDDYRILETNLHSYWSWRPGWCWAMGRRGCRARSWR
jgi:hypothetical protein